jgi:transposase InsO family protein
MLTNISREHLAKPAISSASNTSKPKPYTPKTNGKAERFIQTSLREWAYARAYDSSDERTAELPRWLHNYNWHRPHGSIASKPPISRLALDRNNLLRLHS